MKSLGVGTLSALARPLDRDSEEPLYKQIADRLLELIADGVLLEGDPLPSGPELSRHFDVAPMTVREAINTLKVDGRVVSEKGRGTYVGRGPTLRVALKTMSLSGVPGPPLLGGMPSLPDAETFLNEDSGAEFKVETYPASSVEARVLNRTAMVTFLIAHGEVATSVYRSNWSGPLGDDASMVRELISELKSQVARVVSVRELLTARQPTRDEVARLAMPLGTPVLVTEHLGTIDRSTVVSAWTVRDARIPIEIS